MWQLTLCLWVPASSALFIYQLFWTQACPEECARTGLRSHARCHPYPIPQPANVGHTTGVYDPYSFRIVVWVLLRPTRTSQWKCCETGPTVFRPYPRRLESLTIYRCHYKRALSSKLFKDPECWSGRGLNPRPPARQTGALPPELTRRRFISFLTDIDECSANPSLCDVNANCTNSNGSYSCTCKQGFTGDGATCNGKGIVEYFLQLY